MKLDIGNGKILGTKRVSPNGQISGFTEFAGREVLVVLPEGEVELRPDAREMVEELRTATQQQMRVAFHEYRGLKQHFQGPNEAAKHFLETRAPRSFQGLYDKIESWVQEQTTTAEARVERAIDRMEPADLATGGDDADHGDHGGEGPTGDLGEPSPEPFRSPPTTPSKEKE